VTTSIILRLTAAAAVTAVALAGCSNTTEDRSAPSTPETSSAVPAEAELDPALSQRLTEAVERVMDEADIPGAIVGVWRPDGRYVRAFGVADRASGAPMRTDFFHRIGSVTKTFTVTALLQLVDEGKIGLDDPIDRYVDGVPNGDRITLRQLARMQSGLPNYTNSDAFTEALIKDPYRPFTPQELLDYAFAEPVNFEPGAGFEYSNTNTVLLGLVVEKVTGRPLGEVITERIAEPLDLRDTSFPTDSTFPKPHAEGYTEVDGDEAVTATDWNPSWAWAAGGMISTLDDLRVWAEALADGRLLKPETQRARLETVTTPDMPPENGYGLGLFDINGWIGHNGSLPGYQTVAAYLPEERTTLVIELNTNIAHNDEEPSTRLGRAITEVIAPEHVYGIAHHDDQQPDTDDPPR